MADGSTPATGQSSWAGPAQPPASSGYQPPAPPQQPTSAWWATNAATDPWRNPQSPAVVQHTPEPVLPPVEPPIPAKPAPQGGHGLGLIVTIALVASLVAGGLGAALAVYAIKSSGGATISQPGSDRPLGDYQEVIADVLPSVVTIWIETKDGSGNGSGWVYSSEGYIVTNHHVAALAEKDSKAKMTVQFSDGREAPATIAGTAKSTDIAVLKVDDADLKPLPLANSDDLHIGDPVIAIGAPLGLSHTVTDGIVSALDRPVAVEEGGKTTVMAGIQTDASINPGNSGGPLFDSSGQVVGVNTLIYSFPNQDGEAGSMGLGFAISSNQAGRVAEQIIDDGKATRTVLGTELAESKPGEAGAKVTKVAADTPAADAGLQEDDVITEFDGVLLTSDLQLQALVLKAAPGDKVTVKYLRDGTEAEAQVKLGAAEDK